MANVKIFESNATKLLLVNKLNLILGITLFSGSILSAVLPIKNTFGGMVTGFLWSLILATLAGLFAIFTFCLLAINLYFLNSKQANHTVLQPC